MSALTIRLPDDKYDRLKALSKRRGTELGLTCARVLPSKVKNSQRGRHGFTLRNPDYAHSCQGSAMGVKMRPAVSGFAHLARTHGGGRLCLRRRNQEEAMLSIRVAQRMVLALPVPAAGSACKGDITACHSGRLSAAEGRVTGAQMKRALICTVAALLVGCASMSSAPPPAVRGELAPTGKLRVGLILSNQVLVTKDPKTGELQGVTVILAKKLADRLGVPFEPVGYPNPAGLVRSFGANEWDIAFLAYDPARAQEVDFSPAYMVVDNTYLVPAGSKLQTADAADRPGVKIAVPERSAPDLFLSRSLKAAEIVRVPGGSDASLEALRSGRADAYAENAHMLNLYSERLPGSRVLEGRYTVIQHAVATPRGRAAAAQYVRQFVEESKSDGTVRDAITRAQLHRASPAP